MFIDLNYHSMICRPRRFTPLHDLIPYVAYCMSNSLAYITVSILGLVLQQPYIRSTYKVYYVTFHILKHLDKLYSYCRGGAIGGLTTVYIKNMSLAIGGLTTVYIKNMSLSQSTGFYNYENLDGFRLQSTVLKMSVYHYRI